MFRGKQHRDTIYDQTKNSSLDKMYKRNSIWLTVESGYPRQFNDPHTATTADI